MKERGFLPSSAFFFSLFVILSAGYASGGRLSTPTPSSTPDQVTIGKQVNNKSCATCHGEIAKSYANALQAPALDASEHASEHADQLIHDWIVNGKPGLGRQTLALGGSIDR